MKTAAVIYLFACLALFQPSHATETTAQKEEGKTALVNTPLPRAETILSNYVEKLGGKSNFLNHTSHHMKGKVETPGQGINGTLNVFAAKPNKLVARVELEGIGPIVQGYNGKIGWSINPLTGPTILEGKALEDMVRQADFYNVLHQLDDYKSLETVTKTNFEGRASYKLRLVRKNGEEIFEYYDVETGLQSGYTGTQETQFGPVTVTTVIGDYKKFGDITLPTKMIQKMSGLQQVMTFESVESDKVPDSVFDLPPEITALLGGDSKAPSSPLPAPAKTPASKSK
ncbi:MAG: hypothetical protein SFY81_13845 [Verrucomicrobiota bacterium]|nr:hypothetical protein [Verrucomicrobiota bacterium]